MVRLPPNRILFLGSAMFLLAGCATTSNLQEMRTPAMEPTLPQGSRFAVDFGAFRNAPPSRFELVIFEYRDHEGRSEEIQAPQDGTRICYRVIGLPGETVEVTEDGVRINGEALRGPAGIRYEPAPESSDYQRFNRIELGDDAFFLLGDNSPRALDSRYWGAVRREQILGRVTARNPGADGG